MTVTVANVDIGDLPNDGTGDPLRTAFEKINLNFEELVAALPEGPEGSFQFNSNGTALGTANFAYVEADNTISIGADLLPTGNITIGTNTNRIANLFVGQTSLRIGNIRVNESGNTLTFPLSVLPTSKANIAINNLNADGNITSNGGSLTSGKLQITTFQIVTSNNATNQILFETPAVGFNFGTFKINSRETLSFNSQSATVVINKNTNNLFANHAVYGTIFVNGWVTDYNADVAYGNVRFMVSPRFNTEITHTITYEIVT